VAVLAPEEFRLPLRTSSEPITMFLHASFSMSIQGHIVGHYSYCALEYGLFYCQSRSDIGAT
jgi:hypothetical protein